MLENGIIMQYFEWELSNDGQLWNQLKKDAAHLKELGVSAVWLPPAYKGTGQEDVGYGVYDLYDLGEFDQKGTVRTKYGTKEEYLAAIEALHELDISVYADVVLNHKAGADETERFYAAEVDPNNRQEKVSDFYEIEGWTKFTFPGRKNKYSDFKWDWEHFTGTDLNKENDKEAIYLIKGINKGWSEDGFVDDEFGNFDYLMYADIDYGNSEVVEEIKKWAQWYIDETGVDGFRLDAIKHIDRRFIKDFVYAIRENDRPDFFVVGEYWKADYDTIQEYLEATEYAVDLFDVPLHFNFHTASVVGGEYDLRDLFNNSLIANAPVQAVTFVDNHDSQPGQALESFVASWFKPMAYAFILLRREGFPCLFYGDYYGINGENPVEPMTEMLDKLLYVRRNHAYGEQKDYFDDAHYVGWTRLGDEEHPFGLAAVIANQDVDGVKEMYVGEQYAGETFADYMGNFDKRVTIDENGCGKFLVRGNSVSVWVKDAVTPEEAFVEDAEESEG
ncbi:MAG TPA: alpha-amylase [Candidatus Jeotgalibaca pullicola]|nr:alpha-amylase [Candidatus Jeotgalibaca pullicola]